MTLSIIRNNIVYKGNIRNKYGDYLFPKEFAIQNKYRDKFEINRFPNCLFYRNSECFLTRNKDRWNLIV